VLPITEDWTGLIRRAGARQPPSVLYIEERFEFYDFTADQHRTLEPEGLSEIHPPSATDGEPHCLA